MRPKISWLEMLLRMLAWLTILACAGLLLVDRGYTDDYHIVDLKELSLDYKNFAMINPNGVDAMTWPDPPKESVNVLIKTDIATYFGWDSTIESWTTDSQYRGIGLETRFYARITEHLDLGIYHHSQHELDRPNQLNTTHFLEEDAVELKIYLYRDHKRETIF